MVEISSEPVFKLNQFVRQSCSCNRFIARPIFAAMFAIFSVDGGGDVSASEMPKREYANGRYVATHEKPIGSRKPTSRNWDDIIGEQVIVEGLSWGAYDKIPHAYVIMDGSVIYIKSREYRTRDVNGRLVRIKGKLVAEDSDRGGRGSTRKRSVRTFLLVPSEVKILDRVTWPWMRQAKYESKH